MLQQKNNKIKKLRPLNLRKIKSKNLSLFFLIIGSSRSEDNSKKNNNKIDLQHPVSRKEKI